MTWDMFYIMVIVTNMYATANSYFRFKNGPTDRQVDKFEKSYRRSMTESDRNSFKSTQKKYAIGWFFLLIILIVSRLI